MSGAPEKKKTPEELQEEIKELMETYDYNHEEFVNSIPVFFAKIAGRQNLITGFINLLDYYASAHYTEFVPKILDASNIDDAFPKPNIILMPGNVSTQRISDAVLRLFHVQPDYQNVSGAVFNFLNSNPSVVDYFCFVTFPSIFLRFESDDYIFLAVSFIINSEERIGKDYAAKMSASIILSNFSFESELRSRLMEPVTTTNCSRVFNEKHFMETLISAVGNSIPFLRQGESYFIRTISYSDGDEAKASSCLEFIANIFFKHVLPRFLRRWKYSAEFASSMNSLLFFDCAIAYMQNCDSSKFSKYAETIIAQTKASDSERNCINLSEVIYNNQNNYFLSKSDIWSVNQIANEFDKIVGNGSGNGSLRINLSSGISEDDAMSFRSSFDFVIFYSSVPNATAPDSFEIVPDPANPQFSERYWQLEQRSRRDGVSILSLINSDSSINSTPFKMYCLQTLYSELKFTQKGREEEIPKRIGESGVIFAQLSSSLNVLRTSLLMFLSEYECYRPVTSKLSHFTVDEIIDECLSTDSPQLRNFIGELCAWLYSVPSISKLFNDGFDINERPVAKEKLQHPINVHSPLKRNSYEPLCLYCQSLVTAMIDSFKYNQEGGHPQCWGRLLISLNELCAVLFFEGEGSLKSECMPILSNLSDADFDTLIRIIQDCKDVVSQGKVDDEEILKSVGFLSEAAEDMINA